MLRWGWNQSCASRVLPIVEVGHWGTQSVEL